MFAAKGSVTAGNSSQTSDGAGALILASERAIKQFNLKPLARHQPIRGVPPEIMGIGPKEAIPIALKLAGIKKEDLGWIELNEGIRRAGARGHQRSGTRYQQGQSDGRRNRAWPPAWRAGAIRSATVVHAMRETTSNTAWSRCASGPVWAPRGYLNVCRVG